MPRILLNLDVDDIERAVAFYTQALELRVGRRFDSGFVELLGAEAPLYLLLKTAGTEPFEGAEQTRGYARHWTPLHLDFVVTNLELALERAVAAGAEILMAPTDQDYGSRDFVAKDHEGNVWCFGTYQPGG